MKNLIIDASSLIYRAYYAMSSWAENIQPAVNLFDHWLNDLSSLMKPYDQKFCVIDLNNRKSENFEILDSYKAGRKTPEMLKGHFKDFNKQALIEGYRIVSRDGQEADDVIASLLYRLKQTNDYDGTIIVSSDKDLLQLVSKKDKVVVLKPINNGGTKFQPEKEQDVCKEFGISDPFKIIDLKAFIGDGSDGYRGVKGIGMKRAQKLLEDFDDFDGIYKALDEGKIKGAQARYLEEGRDDAKICYRLAKLNDTLFAEDE